MGPKGNAPSSTDVVGDSQWGESSNRPALQHLFEIKLKSKNGEARHLQLSDVSPHFGRLLPDAAKELGMCRSSLKKACRFFGLPRWPGRKVRALESAMDRVERAMVVERADAGLSSAITKLQQELEKLYHGTPDQINEKMEARGSQIAKRLGYRETEPQTSNLEGLLPEVHGVAGREVPESAVQAQHDNMLTPKTENIGEEWTRVVKVEGVDEWDSAAERTNKRFQFCTKCGLRIMSPQDVYAPAFV